MEKYDIQLMDLY